jgi:glucose-1-phosphate cytidylyltransferase
MKVVVLAGGIGSRLSEETDVRPKPMIEIGGRPILWHIMKHFGHYGINEFLVALGYKGDVIKRYFVDFIELNGSLSVSLKDRHVSRADASPDDWTVHLVETGIDTITGGRLKRLGTRLGGETFIMTYGDGVSDVDVGKLLAFHRGHGRLATVTAVRPPARFGALQLDGDQVVTFSEKSQISEGWINGGYFVLEPQVIDYIEGDHIHWEREPLEHLAREGQLMAYRHESFWLCMDTLRDKRVLEGLWADGRAPWKIWA